MNFQVDKSLPIQELPLSFNGRAEMKNHTFKLIKRSNNAYIYEVSDTFGNKWYEVFKRVMDTRFNKISYPKQKAFGITAWAHKDVNRQNARFLQLTK